MFNSSQIELVKKINASPYKVVLVLTGGGSSFIGDFLSISGGSNTILGAHIPYNAQITENIISFYEGEEKVKLVSQECAEDLCLYGFDLFGSYNTDEDIDKNLFLENEFKNVISISCTASLAKDNEREGRIHEAYISVAFADSMDENISTEHFVLRSSRVLEELELSSKILEILAKACKLNYK